MRRYRNLWHRAVQSIDPGKEGELDLTAQEEAQYLGWGRLEIVPVEYEVVGPRRVSGCAPGEKFKAAFTIGQESSLVEAGHIERAKSKPSKPADKGND